MKKKKKVISFFYLTTLYGAATDWRPVQRVPRLCQTVARANSGDPTAPKMTEQVIKRDG